MSYLALYRKYRPQTLSKVLGQPHIVTILKNAIKLGRISHAYLFSGPKGTGKTSVARILAKEAGCSEIDLMEIDAASSRGIDEIRTLREGVRSYPLRGKVKVYIIDEVHMLTKDAFNALLKTLEEPPAHVIFILATTDREKVPETIISRCQDFSFRKIPDDVLRASIISLAKNEGFIFDEESASLITMLSDGSFRDALGALDQALTFSDENKDKKVTGRELRAFLSIPGRELVEEFLKAIFIKKREEGLLIIEKIRDGREDINIFLKLVLRSLRGMLLLALAPRMASDIKKMLGGEEFKFVEEHKNTLKPNELEATLLTFLNAYEERERSYMPHLPLELAFLKIVSPDDK